MRIPSIGEKVFAYKAKYDDCECNAESKKLCCPKKSRNSV